MHSYNWNHFSHKDSKIDPPPQISDEEEKIRLNDSGWRDMYVKRGFKSGYPQSLSPSTLMKLKAGHKCINIMFHAEYRPSLLIFD